MNPNTNPEKLRTTEGSDQLDGAVSNRELLGQMKVMKIHQGAITHEICCLAAQLYCVNTMNVSLSKIGHDFRKRSGSKIEVRKNWF